MKYLLLILLTLILTGCGREETRNYRQVYNIQPKIEVYQKQAPSGWIMTDECDALLFSALQSIALDVPFNIRDAQNEDGQWFRRPLQDCYANGESQSTISRDMILGVILHGIYWEDLQLLEDLWDYASQRFWKVGDGDVSRTILTPNIISLLGQAIEHLGGPDRVVNQLIPAFSTTPGYISHLTMLQILARQWMGLDGLVDKWALEAILGHSPRNALANTLYDKYRPEDQPSPSDEILETEWPNDELPDEEDWCEKWKTQRADNDKGLKPCPPAKKKHPGGDFLIPAKIRKDKLNKPRGSKG